ncbi:hypothetical protein INR49_016303 [Caranx melampygus]|nr:hypothetical protein INR49_016303 [Caranx melampygus]
MDGNVFMVYSDLVFGKREFSSPVAQEETFFSLPDPFKQHKYSKAAGSNRTMSRTKCNKGEIQRCLKTVIYDTVQNCFYF